MIRYCIIGIVLLIFLNLFIFPDTVKCILKEEEKEFFVYRKIFTEERHIIYLQIGKKVFIDYNKKL